MSAEPSLHDLAREARLPRNLVLADRKGAGAQDLRDCAELLSRSGAAAAADLLFDAATLWLGTLPAVAPACDSTWDVAVAELSDLMSVGEVENSVAADEGALRLAIGEAGDRSEAAFPPDAAWMESAFGPALGAMLAARKHPAPLTRALTVALMDVAFRSRPFDLTTPRRQPGGLATELAFNVTRRILVRRGELAKTPFGGPALFEAAERLTAFGLGLGFRNLVVLAPTLIEIRNLVGEAWSRQPRRGDPVGAEARFIVLLSSGLPEGAQRELVNAAADGGHASVLIGILVRLQRAPADRVDPDLLRDLRDAFLDLRRLPLAAAAQRRLTAVTDGHSVEKLAQDDIETSRRLSGFASTARQRWRRFQYAAD